MNFYIYGSKFTLKFEITMFKTYNTYNKYASQLILQILSNKICIMFSLNNKVPKSDHK